MLCINKTCTECKVWIPALKIKVTFDGSRAGRMQGPISIYGHVLGDELLCPLALPSLSTRSNFIPRGHWVMAAGILGCQSGEEGALASSGQRPGLLLCIPGHTAQPPQVSVVLRLRNPASR